MFILWSGILWPWVLMWSDGPSDTQTAIWKSSIALMGRDVHENVKDIQLLLTDNLNEIVINLKSSVASMKTNFRKNVEKMKTNFRKNFKEMNFFRENVGDIKSLVNEMKMNLRTSVASIGENARTLIENTKSHPIQNALKLFCAGLFVLMLTIFWTDDMSDRLVSIVAVPIRAITGLMVASFVIIVTFGSLLFAFTLAMTILISIFSWPLLILRGLIAAII